MALSLQSSNLVWQKVKNTLSAINTASKGASPATQNAFLDLKMYLATDKRNANLQLIAIDGTATASDSGNTANQVAANAACTLYAIYAQKVGATETILKWTNNATTATTDGTQDGALAATVAGDQFVIYPDGRALSSGLTWTQDTTRTGSTLNLLANAIYGFIIIGA